MKKNMMTVIITALLGLNLVLTALIVFVMVPSLNKVNSLVTDVANILDLELKSPNGDSSNKDVAITDIQTYQISDLNMKINLKTDTDGANHYAALDSVSIRMNSVAEDYSSVSGIMESNTTDIKQIVSDCIAKYTMNAANENREKVREDIQAELTEHFQTDCIIGVSLGGLVFQ